MSKNDSYVCGSISFQGSKEQLLLMLEKADIRAVVGKWAVSFRHCKVLCKIGYVGNITPEQPYDVEADGYGINTAEVAECCKVLADVLKANNIRFEITHFYGDGKEITVYTHYS